MKLCKGCNKGYPATTDYFYMNPGTGDGFQRLCKNCSKAIAREWNTQNRDRYNQNHRRYYLLEKGKTHA